ncbi:MAG: glycoside hydrolase [Thermoplasmata archaeon]|nr:glycoside hydrolase [Thermoplasmata archaeon]
MTESSTRSIRTTSRPLRTLRLAALAAVGIALLMALPLPALAGAPSPAAPAALPVGQAPAMVAPAAASASGSVQNLAMMLAAHPEASSAVLDESHAARIAANSASGVGSIGASGAAPVPQSLSGNIYLNAPCSYATALTAINGTNSTLLTALSSNYLIYNGSGDTFCSSGSLSSSLLTHGFVETERSNDSGATWTPSFVPPNASWTNKSSSTNGSLLGFYYPITNGGPPFASVSVAAANDGTVLLGTQFIPECIALGGNCTSAPGLQAPAGIAVARSTDGGASWANTTVIAQQPFLKYITPTSTCQSAGYTVGYYFTDIPMDPWVGINPSNGVAVAVWDLMHLNLDEGVCETFLSGTVQASVSSNGGVSWSAPVNVSSNASYQPRVAFGPAPTYPITILSQDWQNATQDSTTQAFAVSWETTTSTNNGTSWSKVADTSSTPNNNLLWRGSSSPDSWMVTYNPFSELAPTPASFAIDSGTSAYAGNAYFVWSDNRTAGSTYQGDPSIALQEKASGSLSWSGISYLTPTTKTTAYFEPSVSVAPDGTVWVTFYGMSKSSGDLNLYAVYSTNGGSNWSSIGTITSATSVLAVGLLSIGQYNGLAATSAGAFATWMDCRSSSCTTAYNTSAMVAQIEPIAFDTTAPGVNLTVTTNGVSAPMTLPGAQPWATGTTHSLSAQGWFGESSNGTVASFVNYSGIVNSTAFSTTFDYTGGSTLLVTYVYVPAAYIGGTFSPNITQSRLTIDNTIVTLHPWNATTELFNYSVASGRSYYLNASASNLYASVTNDMISVQSGRTTVVNISLGKTVGWLTGRVSPVNATLLLNGRPVTINASDGIYNVTVQWGTYWLNATGYGVTNASKLVTVNPGQATNTPFNLIGGWLKGTVASTYPGLTINVDGLPVTGLVGATFNESFLGGRHTVEATAPGYNTSWQNWTVTPGRTTNFAISLTNIGMIVGNIGPAGALANGAKLIVNNVTQSTGGNRPINAITGNFAVNATGEVNWTLTVSATGYVTATQVVFVRPGQDTKPVTFVLALSPVVQPHQNCTNNESLCPPTTNNNAGISPLLVGGILVVVVLVAVIAAVVLMRRRPGGGGDTTPPEGSMGGTDGTEASSDTYGGAPPGG